MRVAFSAQSASGELAYQDTARIIAEQSLDPFGAETFLDPGQARGYSRAGVRVVNVRSRGMGQAFLDQSSGCLDLCAVADSGQRGQVHQQRGLAAQAFGHTKIALHRRIPFRVGQDRKTPGNPHVKKGGLETRRHDRRTDLKEEGLAAVVAGWFSLADSAGKDVVPVVLSAEQQAHIRQHGRNLAAHLIEGEPDLVERGLKHSSELVRRGAQIREAHSGQSTHHADTRVKVVGSVVKAGKEVRMQINVMRHGACRQTIANPALI